MVLLATAASSRGLLAQNLGWQSYGPPLFQVSDVSTGIADLTVYAASANFSAGQSAISGSTDGGQTWTGLEQAPTGQFYAEVLADQSDANRLYAGATGSGATTIYFSNTAGTGWAVGQTTPALCLPSFAQSAANGNVLVACGTSLYSTSDGATWTSVTNPFTEATRLAAGPGGTMYAYGPTHIFKSTDSGQTWSPSGSAPGACPSLNALRVNPSNGNALTAGAGVTGSAGFQCGGVYLSSDGGATWSAGGLSGVYVSDLAFDTSQTSTIYASAAFIAGVLPMGGVWRSSDAGATWDNLSLPQPGASRIALSSQNDRLYAATSLGVYQIAMSVAPPTCVVDPVTLLSRWRALPRPRHLDQLRRDERPRPRRNVDRRHRRLLVLRQLQPRAHREGPRGLQHQRTPVGLCERPDQRPRDTDGDGHRHRDDQGLYEPSGHRVRSDPGHQRVQLPVRRGSVSKRVDGRDGATAFRHRIHPSRFA